MLSFFTLPKLSVGALMGPTLVSTANLVMVIAIIVLAAHCLARGGKDILLYLYISGGLAYLLIGIDTPIMKSDYGEAPLPQIIDRSEDLVNVDQSSSDIYDQLSRGTRDASESSSVPPLRDRDDNMKPQLRPAELAFNEPKQVKWGKWTTIELALVPEEAGQSASKMLSDNLEGNATTVATVYYNKMRAVLSGPEFEIDPVGSQDRRILEDQPTSWSWQIKPKSYGDSKLLRLDVYALVDGRDEPPFLVETFQATMRVNITLKDRALESAKQMGVFWAAVSGLVLALISGAAYIWRKLRPPPEKPQKVILRLEDDPPQ